jgi:hypothetical protein
MSSSKKPPLTREVLQEALKYNIPFNKILESGAYQLPGPEEIPPLIHLLDHKYQGPGNNLVGQVPHDIDDEIAKSHDESYAVALSQYDIEQADKLFLDDSISDVIESGNPHSVIGAVGVGVKHILEKVAGPIYPGNYGLRYEKSNAGVY